MDFDQANGPRTASRTDELLKNIQTQIGLVESKLCPVLQTGFPESTNKIPEEPLTGLNSILRDINVRLGELLGRIDI
jgi:hypothetical protein